jgi:hypothetical protein
MNVLDVDFYLFFELTLKYNRINLYGKVRHHGAAKVARDFAYRPNN